MSQIKTPAEIALMREGGKILREILLRLKQEVKIGITTKSLDLLARKLMKVAGVEPAFLGYRPEGATKAYPAALCISVNDVVVHGLPSGYILKTGDVVSIDAGIKHKGFYSDSAFTVGLGEVPPLIKKLIKTTEQSLALGIKQAKAGKRLGDIGYAIQKYSEGNGFSVIRSLTGHGIGRHLHEEPNVFNFGKPKTGERLEVGMVIAIEPMLSSSKSNGKIKSLPDDSFATSDGSISAHFEHTVAITASGPEVLTGKLF